MSISENFENLAKASNRAAGELERFAKTVNEATKAANQPKWPKSYFMKKRKSKP